jgi:tryptophanyl-tRNA synthetase
MSDASQRKRRSLSGIKSTGVPHLGNYLGMMRPAIGLQDEYDAYYFVADYHALTTEQDAGEMARQTYEITAYFLAFGLEPDKAAFFRQSDVPEVCELSWLLSCVTTMGLLERAHAYKAARDRGDEAISHGLFAYPMLMAADILAYDSDVVPVGRDQIQHIEMTRDMAQRFNHVFGETFRLPTALVREEVMTVPGLDGQKMSKSYDNAIEALLPPKQLKRRILQIVTDSTPLEDPKNPDTCNVFALYRLFASADQLEDMRERYRQGGYGYGHAKLALFEVIDAHMAPYRERYQQLIADRDTLEDILRQGARRARVIAREVTDRARQRCGYLRAWV